MNFIEGKQPCQNFKEESGYFGVIEHDCYCKKNGTLCEGTVSFCNNCFRDHHKGGYEKCSCSGVQ